MASDFDNLISNILKDVKNDIKNKNKSTYEGLGLKDSNELKFIANILKEYIRDSLQYYFDNYHATSANGWGYRFKGEDRYYGGRTGQLLESILVNVDENTFTAKVYFDDSKAWRDSLWDGSRAYLPSILNDGYQVKSGFHKHIRHFGYFEGARFIEAGIMMAKKDPLFKDVDIIYEPYGGYGIDY